MLAVLGVLVLRSDAPLLGLGVSQRADSFVVRAVGVGAVGEVAVAAGAVFEIRKDVPRQPTRCKSTRREAMTQVGVAQATEGPTRVLSVRQVDVEYLELSSATTCRGNQSMHAIRLLGLRHGL